MSKTSNKVNRKLEALAIRKLWQPGIRNITDTPEPLHMADINNHGYDYNDYTDVNSYGYRGPKFVKNPEAIMIGCSMTFGEGAPRSAIWPQLLAENLKLKRYVNLGIRGAGIDLIVSNLFEYIEVYGKPKYIFALFPNVGRVTYVANSNLTYDKYSVHPSDFEDCQIEPNIMVHMEAEDRAVIEEVSDYAHRPKYLKRPFPIQDVLSMEYLTRLAATQIKILTRYCKDAGIVFKWSSWDGELCEAAELYKYDCFVPEPRYSKVKAMKDWDGKLEFSSGLYPGCHSDLEAKYKDNFYTGSANDGHWGVHEHAHMSEAFYKSLG